MAELNITFNLRRLYGCRSGYLLAPDGQKSGGRREPHHSTIEDILDAQPSRTAKIRRREVA